MARNASPDKVDDLKFVPVDNLILGPGLTRNDRSIFLDGDPVGLYAEFGQDLIERRRCWEFEVSRVSIDLKREHLSTKASSIPA